MTLAFGGCGEGQVGIGCSEDGLDWGNTVGFGRVSLSLKCTFLVYVSLWLILKRDLGIACLCLVNVDIVTLMSFLCPVKKRRGSWTPSLSWGRVSAQVWCEKKKRGKETSSSKN